MCDTTNSIAHVTLDNSADVSNPSQPCVRRQALDQALLTKIYHHKLPRYYRIHRGTSTTSHQNVFGFISSKLAPLKNYRTYSEAEFNDKSAGGLNFCFLSSSLGVHTKLQKRFGGKRCLCPAPSDI